MRPEYLRFLRHRRIRRWLMFGVLPLLLVGIILPNILRPGLTGLAPRDPWIHQIVVLKLNHHYILEYRAHNGGRWPATFADLSSTVSDPNPQHKPEPFLDPDSGISSPWLLFDPAHVTPLPENGRIIAAAPRPGASRKSKDQNRRIVMFENSVVTWVPEPDFRAATQARSHSTDS